MKAKAAVFMGENLPFEVREFDITKTPLGYGRSRLIASGSAVRIFISITVSYLFSRLQLSVTNLWVNLKIVIRRRLRHTISRQVTM